MSLYRFKIERWKESSRVENRYGDFIDFVDEKHHTTEKIHELMRTAYEQGFIDGVKEKSKQIKSILGI